MSITIIIGANVKDFEIDYRYLMNLKTKDKKWESTSRLLKTPVSRTKALRYGPNHQNKFYLIFRPVQLFRGL